MFVGLSLLVNDASVVPCELMSCMFLVSKFSIAPSAVSPLMIALLGISSSPVNKYSPLGTVSTFLKSGSAFLNNCVKAFSNAVTLSVEPSPTAPKSATLTAISSILPNSVRD